MTDTENENRPEAGSGPPAGPAARPPFFTDFADLVYGIFFSPAQTLRNVAQRAASPLRVTLVAYSIVRVIESLAGGAAFNRSFQAGLSSFRAASGGFPPFPDFSPSSVVAVAVAGALAWAVVGLFVKTGVLGLVSNFFGGRGDSRRLLAALSLTYLPALVGVPFSLLLSNWAGLSLLVVVLILVWRLILDIVAIREVYSLSTGQAVGVALIPLGALLLLGLIVLTVWVVLLMSTFGPLVPPAVPGVG